MKLKKLALNAIAMEHSEMKQIKAGRLTGDDFCNEEGLDGCKSVIGMTCAPPDNNSNNFFCFFRPGHAIGQQECYCGTGYLN